jgi:hypothetical protein
LNFAGESKNHLRLTATVFSPPLLSQVACGNKSTISFSVKRAVKQTISFAINFPAAVAPR